MLWRFNIIPKAGEEGAETWLKADPNVWDVRTRLNAWVKEHPELLERSNRYTGNAGFWAPVTAVSGVGSVLHSDGVTDERLLRWSTVQAATCTRTLCWRSTPRPASASGTSR